MTAPDVPGSDGGTRETSGDPVRENTELVATPEMHAPGQPPGGRGQTEPNHVRSAGRAAFDARRAEQAETRIEPSEVRHQRSGSSPSSGQSQQAAAPVEDGPEPPAESANKPEWVAHAVKSGGDACEAEAMTKAELIEQYGRP